MTLFFKTAAQGNPRFSELLDGHMKSEFFHGDGEASRVYRDKAQAEAVDQLAARIHEGMRAAGATYAFLSPIQIETTFGLSECHVRAYREVEFTTRKL